MPRDPKLPKKSLDPHTQKADMQNGLKTLHFLYRTGLLVFSVKYLVVPFMRVYTGMIHSYVGQRVEPKTRWFDEKILGPLMGWVLFSLHFVLRYLLLATYPAISVLFKFVVIPLKRSIIQGYNKMQETRAEIDPDSATALETLAVQKQGKVVPSTAVIAERAKEEIAYTEETFQFTKIAFKIFYNRLQLAFVDAQFVWGYGPRDPETDTRLALGRQVLADKRDYLLALRNYDQRVEDAMKRQRMAAAAADAEREMESDLEEMASPVNQDPKPATTRSDITKNYAENPPESPLYFKSTVVGAIDGITAKLKSKLGLAEPDDVANNLPNAASSPLVAPTEEQDEEIPSPPTPPAKISPKEVAKILSPDSAALDARVRKVEHLSAIALTPYAAVAVARVQSSERQAVKKAFAKKKKQKKIAYQKTHFMDRLKSVLGMRDKMDDHKPRDKDDISSTYSNESAVPRSMTVAPVPVTEGKMYVAKDTTSEKAKESHDKKHNDADKKDKVKEEKERNAKLPDSFNKGKMTDPSLTFFDRLFGREDESKVAEETTDTLLTEIKNPLATRKSSRMVKDEDDERSGNDKGSDDEESIKRREEEAMRKRRMEYSARQEEEDKENGKRPTTSKPSSLDHDQIMTAYNNPFLKKKNNGPKSLDNNSMTLNEEGESSNDVTPLTTHRSSGSTPSSSTRALKGRTADVLSKNRNQLAVNAEMPRTTAKPALHPFFLASGQGTEEADDHKYLRMVGELNPF